MNCNLVKYRITKYEPMLRNHKGAYMGNDWTSIYDFGDVGRQTTLQLYYDTETAYIDTYMEMLLSKKVSYLTLNHVEIVSDIQECIEKLKTLNVKLSTTQIELLRTIHDGCQLTLNEFPDIFKLVMRELIWCDLRDYCGNIIIEFGCDYYTYITCRIIDENIIEHARSKGIYIEANWKSTDSNGL